MLDLIFNIGIFQPEQCEFEEFSGRAYPRGQKNVKNIFKLPKLFKDNLRQFCLGKARSAVVEDSPSEFN